MTARERRALRGTRRRPARASVCVGAMLLVGAAANAACGTSTPPPNEAHARGDGRATTACEPPAPAPRGFRGSIAPKLGSPRHIAADAVVGVGALGVVAGKFQYGKLGKDLEGEAVALYLADGECGEWRALGERDTDSDGRVRFELPPFEAPTVARYRLVALGDGSSADGRVFAVAPGARAVLFDVDGTLTEDDGELVEDLVGGSADMHAGADAVARRWAERGHLIVYITGRPYPLRRSTQAWLAARGFPEGPLFTTDRFRDALPSRSKVGAFKRARIRQLREAGVDFEAAYGNASTDLCAYAEAGIEPSRTWIIGDEPAPRCDDHTAARGFSSYVDHLESL